MLNLPVHGPTRSGSAHPLLRAAPVRREPLGPHRHQLSHRRAAGRHLPARPRPCLAAATRVDLEAFLADLLARRTATAATYQKVLKILDGWLAEDEETPTSPILSADSSPAKASILVPREDLNLGSPASHAGAVPPELQGQGVVLVETRGSNLRPRCCQRRAQPAELRPRVAGVVQRPGVDLHSRRPRFCRPLPSPMGCLCLGRTWWTC